MSDASGGTASVGVTVSVTDVNEAPVAVEDTAETVLDTMVVIAVLDNDTDEDDGDILSVRSVAAPGSGTATVNTDGTVTYTPAAAFTGEDSFVYTVTDGTLSATATVSVLVRETCTNGTAVPNPADNPELVEDCNLLLSVADTIAGEGILNWGVDTPITEWEGVFAAGEQPRGLRASTQRCRPHRHHTPGTGRAERSGRVEYLRSIDHRPHSGRVGQPVQSTRTVPYLRGVDGNDPDRAGKPLKRLHPGSGK